MPYEDELEDSRPGTVTAGGRRAADDPIWVLAARRGEAGPVGQPGLARIAARTPDRGRQLVQREHEPGVARPGDGLDLHELHVLGGLLELLDGGAVFPGAKWDVHAGSAVSERGHPRCRRHHGVLYPAVRRQDERDGIRARLPYACRGRCAAGGQGPATPAVPPLLRQGRLHRRIGRRRALHGIRHRISTAAALRWRHQDHHHFPHLLGRREPGQPRPQEPCGLSQFGDLRVCWALPGNSPGQAASADV